MGSRRQHRTAGQSPLNTLERLDWEWLALGEITQDPHLQMRLEGLDEKHVRDLMATVEDKGIDDAIIVVREGKTYWLADGFHRVEAYRRVAIAQGVAWETQRIKAFTQTGTFEDAKQLARKANLRHGKPLSPASRKAILFDMVRGGEEINGLPVKRLSNGVLAAELGVHKDTIAEWFRELIEEMTDGIPSVTVEDRTVVYGRDGREINVTTIQHITQQRHEEERKRKAVEQMETQAHAEAEKLARYRSSNVIFRAKFVAEMLLATASNRNLAGKLKIDLWSDHTPDEQKTQAYYQKMADRRFTLSTDREMQFLRDFKAPKEYRWYQDLLNLPAHIWQQAEEEDWDETTMQTWLVESQSFSPRTSMAQPKHGDRAYPLPAPMSRHRLTPTTTEVAVEEHGEPTYPCPFRIGQNVRVLATDEPGIVHDTTWVNLAWAIQVNLYNGLQTFRLEELAHLRATEATDGLTPRIPFQIGDIVQDSATGAYVEVVQIHDASLIMLAEDDQGDTYEYEGGWEDFTKITATPEQLAQATANPAIAAAALTSASGDPQRSIAALFEHPTSPDDPYEMPDEIAQFRAAYLACEEAVTQLKNIPVTLLRLQPPLVKQQYVKELTRLDDYAHGVVAALIQLIGRAVNV
ncbi:MAG: ParB N-terminal domain-containing protein [Chloroflexi bacterium]|nr:ParB N-terminal domain-containing protein [Chloroflexota bacterium]